MRGKSVTRRYRKLCQEDKQEIEKMLKSGCSVTKIATTLGIHRDLIYSEINDNGQIRTSEYIANFSGGKDSAATIILAKEHGEPLDEIIFSEVMYSKNISGELPEHINFIKMWLSLYLKLGVSRQEYYGPKKHTSMYFIAF